MNKEINKLRKNRKFEHAEHGRTFAECKTNVAEHIYFLFYSPSLLSEFPYYGTMTINNRKTKLFSKIGSTDVRTTIKKTFANFCNNFALMRQTFIVPLQFILPYKLV